MALSSSSSGSAARSSSATTTAPFSTTLGLIVVSSAVTATLTYLWTKQHTLASTGGNTTSSSGTREFEAGQQLPSNNSTNEGDDQHVPYVLQRLSLADIRQRTRQWLRLSQQRRTVRFFSSDPVPRDIIRDVILTAATAPSGAHCQPWVFVAVSNAAVKAQIRSIVERHENTNYHARMSKTWVNDVSSMVSQLHGTGPQDAVHKPYLTDAPWVIVVFKQPYAVNPETNERVGDHYYVSESVGIASGMLVQAITNANLVTLTSTPMGADAELRTLLGRPASEKVFLLLPVGFPAKNATVPYRPQERKPESDVLVWST